VDGCDPNAPETYEAEPRNVKPVIEESNKEYARHVGCFGYNSNFYVNYPFRVEVMEQLEYKRKGIRIRQIEEGNYKPHANLAFDRVVGEILNLNAAYTKFGDDLVMIDVGGSPNRAYIHEQKFSKILYLCPTLDAADVVRSLNRSKDDRVLECTLSQFRTAKPHFLNFTQSLYYVGLEGLFEYMYQNRNCRAAFCTVHNFSGERGELFNEATYVKRDGKVDMHVAQTNKTYRHPALDILRERNGMIFERNGEVYTLAWDYHDHTPITDCYIFVMRRGYYEVSRVVGMQSHSSEEDVTVNSYHGNYLYSFTYNSVNYQYIREVQQEVAIKARFLEKNAANFATVCRAVLRERRELVKVYTSRAIIANVAKAFYGEASFEKNVIMTHEHETSADFRNLSHVLQDKYFFYHDWKFSLKLLEHPLVISVGLIVKLGLIYCAATADMDIIQKFLSFILRVPLLIRALSLRAIEWLEEEVAGIRVPDYGHSPLEKMPQPLEVVKPLNKIRDEVEDNYFFLYLLNFFWMFSLIIFIYFSHKFMRREHRYSKIINGLKVYWYRTDYEVIPETHQPTLSSDTPLKKHQRGFIEEVDPSRKMEKDKPLYPLLGNINGYTPNNTSGTVEFTETAINLRWLECGPSEALSVKTWKTMHDWLTKTLNTWHRPEALSEITVDMFKEWISRYTGLKLKMLVNGVKHLDIVNNDTISHAGWSAFIKREKLYKTMDAEIKPRGIVHANPVYNAFFGPWFYNMYKKVKEMFTLNGIPITIASGINRTQLSQKVNELYKERGFDHIYENDFTQFEKTHTYGAYILESIIYKFLGMPSYLVDNYVRLHGKTRAKTSKYSSFEVDYARFSGDQTTSLGNSLVNALVTYFILRFIYGFKDTEFHLIVLGDDILIFTVHSIDINKLSDNLAEFGFRSKLREASIMDATFLSMNFLKCEDGNYYAFPRIGKFLLSRSHCTSVSGRDDPQGVLKANFLSEAKYTRVHPVLGPFVKSVLQSMKNYKIKKQIELEVNELSKYRLNQKEDAGYYSNVDKQFFDEYMLHNYGLSPENYRDMNFNLCLLGNRHDGIKDPFVDVILSTENL
jgi:hypothetical protein